MVEERLWAVSAAPSSPLAEIIYGADMLWTETWGRVSRVRGRTCPRDVKCDVHDTVGADVCDGWARGSRKCKDRLWKLSRLWVEALPRCWKEKHPGCCGEWNPLFVSLEPGQTAVLRIGVSGRLCAVQFLLCLPDGDWFTDLESNSSPCKHRTSFLIPLLFVHALAFKTSFRA